MGDGRYVKVYMNGVRVANAPNADLGRSNRLTFHVKAWVVWSPVLTSMAWMPWKHGLVGIHP